MRSVFSKKKFFHSSIKNQFKNVTIPVPWGKISGKWWGSTNIKPILCLHGFRDNCGTFDKLIPFLSGYDISFLAIDLPGHGFSSPFPKGMVYNFINYTILVQLIYEYFNWSKLSFMGHSFGSMISFTSTVLYPEKVNFLICIDALSPLRTPVSRESVRKSINDYIKYNKFDGEPPCYSLEEIKEKMNSAYHHSLNLESIQCLLERTIAPSEKFPGKYYFTTDPMLKVGTMFNWHQEQMIKDVAVIKNPIFICEAKQTNLRIKNYWSKLHEIVDVLRKSSKECDFHSISGTHHLHLNEPEKIVIPLKNFLSRHYVVESSDIKDFTIFSDSVPNILKDQEMNIKNKL